MIEKHARLASGGANPFIDPANCTAEADVQEAMYKATLAEQQRRRQIASGNDVP